DLHDTGPSPTIQRILEERARALARPLLVEPAGERLDLAVLTIGGERYGVDIQHVQEVRSLSALTPVPGAPPIWAGVMNLRSNLYPILNMRRYLALPEDSAAEGGVVVLVGAAGLVVGLLADDMREVRQVPRAEIAPPLAG